MRQITIIGGGLAGCEACWQAVQQGCKVQLIDMKPTVFSPAHHLPLLAELVCSNSLRSNDPFSAVGLLKEEMRRCNSLLMAVADHTQVPAGRALAVDRQAFAEEVTARLRSHPLVAIVAQEIQELPEPDGNPVILATGPLTAPALANSLTQFTGQQGLAFYDAIAPIVYAESLNRDIIYQKSRYDDGPGDYLNCPFSKDEYLRFIEVLRQAEYMPLKTFEDPRYFEGCLPIEVLCARGEETLRFGPMKPVGLPDPRTGRDPYAVVQLRKENQAGSTYNMVGFQTKMTYPAQQRIFRTIPGMAGAEFARLGSIHRNTFICAPQILLPTLQTKQRADLFIAGQLSGVEGYVESAAMGLLAGINAARLAQGLQPATPPPDTALGALITHLTGSDARHFQPSNVNFSLFPAWQQKTPRRLRGQLRSEQALVSLDAWQKQLLLNHQ